MSKQALMPLSMERHGHSGWIKAGNYGFARRQSLVSMCSEEVPRASQQMPVALRRYFDRWEPVAVMGPVKGVNLFIGVDGRWLGSFVPAKFRMYPFQLHEESYGLALWQDYSPVHQSTRGARPFFSGKQLTEELKSVERFLRRQHDDIETNHRVLADLHRKGVLIPWQIPGLEAVSHEKRHTELFRVDTGRLQSLDADTILTIFAAGAFRWLYAHAESLHHAESFRERARELISETEAARRQHVENQSVSGFMASLAQDSGDAFL